MDIDGLSANATACPEHMEYHPQSDRGSERDEILSSSIGIIHGVPEWAQLHSPLYRRYQDVVRANYEEFANHVALTPSTNTPLHVLPSNGYTNNMSTNMKKWFRLAHILSILKNAVQDVSEDKDAVLRDVSHTAIANNAVFGDEAQCLQSITGEGDYA